jgi:hypothetical protein
VATSTGSTDGQQISLNGRAAGTYYIHVFGLGGAKNPNYTLEIDPPTPPPATADTTFNIQFLFNGLTGSQITIFQQAAQKWQSIITGDLPSAQYFRTGFTNSITVDDILIDASATSIDGVGNILGQSNSDAVRAAGSGLGAGLPYHGNMQFDSADLAALQANGSLLSVVEHEMAHVLGFGTLWASKGLLVNSGTANVGFTGAQALANYNTIFGTSATSVPVENTGGAGTANSHWRETVFGSELMTGFFNVGVFNPLSRVTVASMADLGYTVNFAAADPYTPATGTGSGGTLLVAGSPLPTALTLSRLSSGTPAALLASSATPKIANASPAPPPVQLASPLTDLLKRPAQRSSAAAIDTLLANWTSLSSELKAWALTQG